MTELVEKFTASQTGDSLFRFKPHPHPLSRLETCDFFANDIDGRLIVEIDNYFTEEESALFRNPLEALTFFSAPPPAFTEIYRLLAGLGHKIGATFTTLSPSFSVNFLDGNSRENRDNNIHADIETEKGVPYPIPKLYAPGKFFPQKFVNGARGNPLCLTLTLYACADNFMPQYLMGTLYYDKMGEPVYCTSSEHMRMVLFESDIMYTAQESNIPEPIDTWRAAYVCKLLINPHAEGQCLRSLLQHELYGKHG